MDNQARGQAVGNAAKIAADLTVVALNGATVTDTDSLVALFQDIHGKVATGMIALNESLEVPTPGAPQPVGSFNAEQAVVSAFPGTAVVSAPQAAPVAAVVAPPSAVVAAPQVAAPAPAAIPHAGNPAAGDAGVAEAWEVFFTDVNNRTFETNWFDNRTSKRSANSPDFRHKTWKRKPSDKYTVGLYLVSDKNPVDLPQRLAAVGIQV